MALGGNMHSHTTKQAVARFRVDWLAQITRRGPAIAGEILEGRIRVGDRIVAPATIPGVPLDVMGVEFADNVSTRAYWISLLVALATTGPALRR